MARGHQAENKSRKVGRPGQAAGVKGRPFKAGSCIAEGGELGTCGAGGGWGASPNQSVGRFLTGMAKHRVTTNTWGLGRWQLGAEACWPDQCTRRRCRAAAGRCGTRSWDPSVERCIKFVSLKPLSVPPGLEQVAPEPLAAAPVKLQHAAVVHVCEPGRGQAVLASSSGCILARRRGRDGTGHARAAPPPAGPQQRKRCAMQQLPVCSLSGMAEHGSPAELAPLARPPSSAVQTAGPSRAGQRPRPSRAGLLGRSGCSGACAQTLKFAKQTKQIGAASSTARARQRGCAPEMAT